MFATLRLVIAGLTGHPSRMMDARLKPGHDGGEAREVVLFADTFNRYFERENLDAALAVLDAGGYRVHVAKPADGSSRPLCCGRTFLSIGQVDEARREAERTLAALAPFVSRGIPVIGLEPSCLLSFRDEIPALVKGERRDAARRRRRLTFEEFLAREAKAGRLKLPLKKIAERALVHGHCHQKAFDAFSAVETRAQARARSQGRDRSSRAAAAWPAASAMAPTPSTCRWRWANCRCCRRCARRRADTIIVADGTSCRHQIHDGTGREALHVARVLAMSSNGCHAREAARS